MNGIQDCRKSESAPNVNQPIGTKNGSNRNINNKILFMNQTDLIGKRFGRLLVISFHAKCGKESLWSCKCNCGNIKIARRSNLLWGDTKSCGCFKKELHTTHGMTTSLEYKVWEGIKARCENENTPNYNNYGGRGIMVCKEWSESFEKFYADMGKRPNKGRYTIERKDNDGNYESNNCKWATYTEQSRNKRPRTNSLLGINGIDWIKRLCKYRVRISIDGKSIHIGCFKSLEDAIQARKNVEIKYWDK